MLIHATEEELRSIETELLHHQQSGENLEVQVIPDDENPQNTSGYEATSLLHLAAKYGNAKATRHLVDSGYNVNIPNPSGCTPLALAIFFNERDIARILLDANADVFSRDRSGVCAAELALLKPKNFASTIVKRIKTICRDDSEATAKKLLEVGCSLGLAAYLRDTSVLRHMLDSGRAVDERDPHNPKCTALHHAVRISDLGIVNLLLDRGIDANVVDRHGKTALFYYNTESADTSEKLEVLKTMLDRGASLYTLDKKSSTPVQLLLRAGQKDTVRLLLKYVGDIHIKNYIGEPLLFYLMANTKRGVIEVWRNENWNFNVRDRRKRTALWAATHAGNTESLEFLLERDVDANAEDSYMYTVLMSLAAYRLELNNRNILKCVEILLRYGANERYMRFNMRADRIDTTLIYCPDNNNFALAKIILAHAALMEELGVPVPIFEMNAVKLNSEIRFQKYFSLCKRWLEKMKKTAICGSLTLFEFLASDAESIKIHARNSKLVAQLERIWYNQRRSSMYYCNILRRKIRAVMQRVELKNLVVLFVSENSELCSNDYLIEKIADFVN